MQKYVRNYAQKMNLINLAETPYLISKLKYLISCTSIALDLTETPELHLQNIL